MQKSPRRRRLPKLQYRGSTWVSSLSRFWRLGSLILPFFTSVDPAAQGTYLKNLPLSLAHLLGTNALGQDIFWYLVFSIRNSLMLGVSVSLGITAISTFMGLSAGFIGGGYERIVVILIDTFITIPVLPILIVLGALVRGNTSFVDRRPDPDRLRLGLGRAHHPLDGAVAARARVHQHGALFGRQHLRSSSARSSRMSTPTWWSALSTRSCSRSTPRRRWR